MGTPDYMAHEQRADSSVVDGRADLYSVGATMYAMLTGERPKAIRLDRVDPVLRDFIGQLLEESLNRRPESAEMALNVLKKIDMTEGQLSTVGVKAKGCPKCGTAFTEGAEFCKNCGAHLVEPCPGCGKEDTIGTTFCSSCGTNIPEYKAEKKQEGQALLDEAREKEKGSQDDKKGALEIYRKVAALDKPYLVTLSEKGKLAADDLKEELTRWQKDYDEYLSAIEQYMSKNDYQAGG